MACGAATCLPCLFARPAGTRTAGSEQQTLVQSKLWPDLAPTDPEVVAKTYNEQASTYRERAFADGWKVTFAMEEADISDALKQFEGGERISVLDAGCGDGALPAMFDFPANVSLHGIDLSEGMLEYANKTGAYSSLHRGNLEFSLPFPRESFDLIVCNGVLSYIGSNTPLQNMLEILKPGGRMILAFRHTDFVNHGYESAIGNDDALKLLRKATFDPFPGNAAYKHDYVLAVVEKGFERAKGA